MVDVGTGDGAFVVAAAAASPDALVIGLDANLTGLGAGFERAARRRVPNTLFVLGAAEELPGPLAGVAAEVHVQFPWGSLLSAVLSAQARGIGDLLAPDGGTLVVSLSIVGRDHVEGVDGVDGLGAVGASGLAARLASAVGGDVTAVEALTAGDVRAGGSTWAKRLGVGKSRPGYRLTIATGSRRGAVLAAAPGDLGERDRDRGSDVQ